MDYNKELFASNNPVQITLIENTLKSQGIDFHIKGQQALELGNVELTGVQGASVHVKEQDYKLALSAIQTLGLDTDIGKNKSNDKNFPYAIKGLAIAFTLIVLYMIYAFLREA